MMVKYSIVRKFDVLPTERVLVADLTVEVLDGEDLTGWTYRSVVAGLCS